ncbi:carbamoyltransferase HypF, partial [Flavobacterium sp.]|uniref:carbamoyltransferase HypF n=1 Tax=Flavobacterium sp. TaxID=239 RepID=UPI0025BEC7C7
METTYQIAIAGRVQGVGFRPFIYRLANQLNLNGFVSNDELGVIIIVQGNQEKIISFYQEIEKQKPKSAQIYSSKLIELIEEKKYNSFIIKPTEDNITINLPLTPEFALCKNCKTEILNPLNPRYFYPFTTCTECGPRYSITKRFPFERENTSMNEFQMCENCLHEYENPSDIRFHSQTNSCPKCGIQIKLTDNEDNSMHGNNKQLFEQLCEKLAQGLIVAVKNTAGYLLLCDATNKKTVQALRIRKKRPTKPFAVLFPNFEQIDTYLVCSKIEKEQLNSIESPIVILNIKNQLDLAQNDISPNLDTIGAMLPNSGTLFLLSTLYNKPLIATSGNFHGSPICATEEEAKAILKPIADYFFHNTIEIQHPQDDSVVKFSAKNQQKIILRRSRGFAPNILLNYQKSTNQKLLSLGGDLKNTISIMPNNYCYTSEYIGDLSNYETYNRFIKTINNYKTLFDFNPDIILCDKHPNYESNKAVIEIITENKKVEIVKIQHHEAHFAAILGEKELWKNKEKILGVIWDGIGFGTENEIFGGEFFEFYAKKITRIGHLEYFSWVLADKMSGNPKIAALSISENATYFHNYFDSNELTIYTKLIEKATIKTSSMGRFFDAVAFVLGFEKPISFEGEAGMYIENLAQKEFNKQDFKLQDYLKNEKITNQVPTKKLLLKIVNEVECNVTISRIALNFHYTLVKCIEKIAIFSNVKEIAFSGGVFQNSVLVDLLINTLQSKYKLYFHEILSPNDENISVGQLE